jgi:hypothetical protein
MTDISGTALQRNVVAAYCLIYPIMTSSEPDGPEQLRTLTDRPATLRSSQGGTPYCMM